VWSKQDDGQRVGQKCKWTISFYVFLYRVAHENQNTFCKKIFMHALPLTGKNIVFRALQLIAIVVGLQRSTAVRLSVSPSVACWYCD